MALVTAGAYDSAVSHKSMFRDGEFPIIAVTPVSRGVIRPLLLALALIGAVIAIGTNWKFVHRYELIIAVIVGAGPAFVTLTRWWRWRSHKVIVSSERLITLAGISSRRRTSLELSDVYSTTVEQRWWERVLRRGAVFVETEQGSVYLGRVRHPEALARVIDRQRTRRDDVAQQQLDEGDRLSDALSKGLLTDDEYDERWRHLFGPDGPRG